MASDMDIEDYVSPKKWRERYPQPKFAAVVERSLTHPDTPWPEDRTLTSAHVKDTNPKDAVGIRRWRQFTSVPLPVIWELGVAMLEGARKYGRHNYRVAGVRASVYVDAAKGHIDQWWEGEDKDPDSKLSHLTKAIASLVVLRDAMINDKMVDDRPPKAKLDRVRDELQAVVDDLFDRYPEPKAPFTQTGEH